MFQQHTMKSQVIRCEKHITEINNHLMYCKGCHTYMTNARKTLAKLRISGSCMCWPPRHGIHSSGTTLPLRSAHHICGRTVARDDSQFSACLSLRLAKGWKTSKFQLPTRDRPGEPMRLIRQDQFYLIAPHPKSPNGSSRLVCAT